MAANRTDRVGINETQQVRWRPRRLARGRPAPPFPRNGVGDAYVRAHPTDSVFHGGGGAGRRRASRRGRQRS